MNKILKFIYESITCLILFVTILTIFALAENLQAVEEISLLGTIIWTLLILIASIKLSFGNWFKNE